MELIKKWFARQKLNVKFTITIVIIVFIPISAIFLMLFRNIKENSIQQSIGNMKYNMNQNYSVIQKTVDLCNMSTQVFLNYQNLRNFLIDLDDGTAIDTWDLVDFYKDDIGMLERLVNSNPYLYQIRVYADSNDFSEMMPILYRRERLDTLPWSQTFSSGEWQFDYKDTVFQQTVNSSQHTMALVTTMEDYQRGDIGVVEVAVRMDAIFPDIFKTSNDNWACFVDKNGKVYTQGEDGKASKWDAYRDEILARVDLAGQEESYTSTIINGEQVIVGILPIKELGGYEIRLFSLENILKGIVKERNLYFVGLAVALVVIVFIINFLVKALLKRFYEILTTIRQIQGGDLEARVWQDGSDEMGELGRNVNIMLDTMDRLLNDNIKRELLMKNSEIRALQNQINAHFIYNVLESIKMMAEIDEKYAISDAVTSLGKLLRYGMKWSTKNVTVGQEIDYIKNYLELINLRFDYRINLALTIPDFIYEQEIPKMSLQPIIENSIYHGIEELAEDSSIYIKALIEGEDYVIEITDSGKGMSDEEIVKLQKKINGELEVGGGSGNGIGLKNVQDRIRISFGEKYGISIVSKMNCYTKVMVKLPITHIEVNKNEKTVNC